MRKTRSAFFALGILGGIYVLIAQRREPPIWMKDTLKRILPFPLNRRSIRHRLARLFSRAPAVSNALESLDRPTAA